MADVPTAARKTARQGYRCAECGLELPRWVGRCPECSAWNSVHEHAAPSAAGLRAPLRAGAVSMPARRIGDVDAGVARARPTGIAELDRVLGGGLVAGAVVLVAGEPGVGKSTLLLEAAARWAASGETVLLVSGEESAAQVRLRAERTGALQANLWLAAETDLGAVLAHLDAVRPTLLVVDSVQTVASAAVDGATGGVTQVREVAAALTRVAKERGICTLLVGHVTKEGAVAGPRVLEHLVDVVLHFEGDPHSALRLVRGVKNRYGPADEVGCFEMTADGIRGVADPSGLFVSAGSASREPAPGSCVTVTLEGRRPLLAEVQALVGATQSATPRRAVSGLDASRVAMVTAIAERRGRTRIGAVDVFAATVAGMRVADPAADLALALALDSSAEDRPLAAGLVAVGELGLSGELRPVPALGRRLAEAQRLGLRWAVVPVGGAGEAPVRSGAGAGLTVLEAADLPAALRRVRRLAARGSAA